MAYGTIIMNDDQFRRLLDILGLSWQGYRRVRKGIKKRLVRYIHCAACGSVNEYLERVASLPEVMQEARILMTVSISHFFRDRSLWRALEEAVIPEILSVAPDRVKVWSAGCALGQEVYSFKIIWELIGSRGGSLPALFLLATDVNPEYLRRARAGIYDAGAVKGLAADIRDTWFTRTEDRYSVSAQLKDGVSWERYDLSDPVPRSDEFHIIFLRNNLLTYYTQAIQEAAFPKIMGTLVRGGYVVIGDHERLPSTYGDLTRSDSHPCIFRKS